MKWILWGLGATLLLLQVRLWTGDGGVMQGIILKRDVNKQETLVARLKDRNVTLEAEVKDLKNRLEALEERARSDLGMVREGETFYHEAS
jgi:cell division protein FtsB